MRRYIGTATRTPSAKHGGEGLIAELVRVLKRTVDRSARNEMVSMIFLLLFADGTRIRPHLDQRFGFMKSF